MKAVSGHAVTVDGSPTSGVGLPWAEVLLRRWRRCSQSPSMDGGCGFGWD